MVPGIKTAEGRRKSGSKPTLLVTLTVSPARLRELLEPDSVDNDVPVKELQEETKESPATSGTPAAAPPASTGENASDSNAATPVAEGTPADSAMGPPAEGAKKKGVKRSAAAANGSGDSTPKPKGKPGPKKKPRLEDGTVDHAKPTGGHKLGPKANQGAINAGLRALDRSGKPCRKWAKGGFKLKSFTGVAWEIPRWTAPPRLADATTEEDSAAASAAASAEGGSINKENKENAPEANSGSNSNSGADVEMQSAPSVHAASPAPLAIAAAS
ncbi:hypothetical protein S40285_01246 [Stachybotrys chlorohalonatus IBT 40285]|uniref:INO80 complex subunit 4 n=1 Tax=Stachybotrys chlorohalonatus (strain IBT 40285) TaxID=1283841 RepID=A0A084QQX0_STAC4|nr:hypothetical protein S40285_01246 [Stachybotrys chlorohalonata IBT 40285]